LSIENLTSTRNVDEFGFKLLNIKQDIIMYSANYVCGKNAKISLEGKKGGGWQSLY